MTRPALAAMLASCALGATRCAPYESDARASELRPTPDAGALPPSFDADDRVERYAPDGATVAVHFTRAGRNAVPASDADGDGWPDYVTLVAQTYEQVLAHEARSMRFRAPLSDLALADNGGDGRFDVYLLDFNGRGDGAFRVDQCGPEASWRCRGHMLQENDFAGYGYPSLAIAVRTVASHELFHGVQASYRASDSATLSEGTAVWATERFDPSLDDLERLSAQYLAAPDRALDAEPSGPADAFSYGVSLWFLHQSERHSDALIESLLASRDQREPGSWVLAHDQLLRARGSSFEREFVHFAGYCLRTGALADPALGPAAGARLRTVATTALAQGVPTSTLRLFRSSFRVFELRAPPASLSLSITIESAQGPEQTRLLLAPIRAGRIAAITEHPLQSQSLAVGDAERALLVAVNGNASGSSTIFSLCAQCATSMPNGDSDSDSDAGALNGDASLDGSLREPAPIGGCHAQPDAPRQRTGLFARLVLLCAALYSLNTARRLR